GRGEEDLALQSRRDQALALGVGARAQRGDLGRDRRGRGDEVGAGEAVPFLVGVQLGRRRLVGARERDARGQAHDALGAAAPLPRLAHLDEAGALQLAQVVVHLLARQAEPARQPARRLRLLQPLEQAEAERRQRRGGVADVTANLTSAGCHAFQGAGSHLTNNLSIPASRVAVALVDNLPEARHAQVECRPETTNPLAARSSRARSTSSSSASWTWDRTTATASRWRSTPAPVTRSSSTTARSTPPCSGSRIAGGSRARGA